MAKEKKEHPVERYLYEAPSIGAIPSEHSDQMIELQGVWILSPVANTLEPLISEFWRILNHDPEGAKQSKELANSKGLTAVRTEPQGRSYWLDFVAGPWQLPGFSSSLVYKNIALIYLWRVQLKGDGNQPAAIGYTTAGGSPGKDDRVLTLVGLGPLRTKKAQMTAANTLIEAAADIDIDLNNANRGRRKGSTKGKVTREAYDTFRQRWLDKNGDWPKEAEVAAHFGYTPRQLQRIKDRGFDEQG